jgi:hypothetical protein
MTPFCAVAALWMASQPLESLTREVARSGRVLEIAESPSRRAGERPRLAPGAPPMLSFRLFEGKTRHRFGNLDLVMDDAGH